MNVNEARKKYVLTTKIYLDEGEKKEEGDFVEIREPTLEEMNGMNDLDKKEWFESVKNLLAGCLVNHSFTDDDGCKARNEDVYKLLKESGSLFVRISTEWMESAPFQQRLGKERK